jgi:FAD/FMN-containing dehydrogenase
MTVHEEKVGRVCRQLREHRGPDPLSLKKLAVSHEVPKLKDKRSSDRKVDLTDMNEVLSIDTKEKVCIAEPGVTFFDLVKATMAYGLVPLVVPELKTITIGGAVAGCSLESMSYKYGGFHDTCLEYEVITGKGDVLHCTPDNENSLIFQMVHGTFGTLGIISKLKFRLISAKPFVKVTHERYGTLDELLSAIWGHYKAKDVDFMDGMVHSPRSYVLSVADFVDDAPYTHNYDWTMAYHESTKKRDEDFLTTSDYFFRYDKGVTHTRPNSFLGRLLFRKFLGSTFFLSFATRYRRFLSPQAIPITIDVFIPFSKVVTFLEWYEREMGHYPLWCVPYKRVRDYEWLSADFARRNSDELFLDLAVYGMKHKKDKNYYRLLEEELMEIGGLKTLISGNYYTEPEFWKIWNRDNYDKVKHKTDPDDIFRDLYTKMCRTTRGLGR